MVKPRKERRKRWFCSLCGSYDILKRTAHLIKDHNVTSNALNQRTWSLFDQIFSEAVI